MRASRPPSELVLDSDRALRAMRTAVRAAVLSHKRMGDPIVVWENGQVRWIAPEDIVVPDEPA
jgi:hypothetical protein